MKLEKGELKIDLLEILDHMTETQRRWLFRCEAFKEEAVKGVVDFLCDGMAYMNQDDCIVPEDGVEYQPDCWWVDQDTQIRMTEGIAPRLSEVAAELVATLKTELEHHKHCHHEYRRALWDLQRTWNDQEERYRNADVNVIGRKRMSKEEAAEWIQQLEAKLDSEERAVELQEEFLRKGESE